MMVVVVVVDGDVVMIMIGYDVVVPWSSLG